ncbi:CIR protein [Plasmodium chabaudi chabaudi]|uniref:CIR protein n=1 Tax=Plasmodium chabaudi chabaudi TaxID=31271 RepID=A0A4V0K784_PLACU|nr:CIR protein [Plasmodium chabaudi chabaudi]VTZ68595.1 CIR protein [Plasmodium chabaudi chabaudi]|eukprot:XP_016652925.1 CIR protein [Plasmodium chabaudi chabaudi]
MSEELCKAIDEIDKNVVFNTVSQTYTLEDKIYGAYCPGSGNGEKGQCDSDDLKLGSAFMALLNNFKSIDEKKLESDKLSQYAILWFNSKVKVNEGFEPETDNIYNILNEHNLLSEYREYTDKNEDVMKIYYAFLKNLYTLLKEICNTINKCKGSSTSTECQNSGEKCVELYNICHVTFPWKEFCNPYCRVLSNLKNDYDNLRKNNDHLPELKPPPGVKSCEETCAQKCKEPEAKEPATEVSKIVTPAVVSLPDSSVTTTSINNGNKLPYIAVPLILIPIILGISYKYLTPVWRKKMKRKTMKKIINLSDQKKA